MCVCVVQRVRARNRELHVADVGGGPRFVVRGSWFGVRGSWFGVRGSGFVVLSLVVGDGRISTPHRGAEKIQDLL